MVLIDFQWSLNSCCLSWFKHAAVLLYFEHCDFLVVDNVFYQNKDTKRNQKGEILSFVSPIQVYYK